MTPVFEGLRLHSNFQHVDSVSSIELSHFISNAFTPNKCKKYLIPTVKRLGSVKTHDDSCNGGQYFPARFFTLLLEFFPSCTRIGVDTCALHVRVVAPSQPRHPRRKLLTDTVVRAAASFFFKVGLYLLFRLRCQLNVSSFYKTAKSKCALNP